MLKFVKSLGKKSPGNRRLSHDKGGKRTQGLENDESFASWVSRNNDDNEQGPVYIVRDKDLGKLHKAAWYGQLDKVKVLAKRDPSAFDKCHRTPLHLACCQGYANIVQELLAWNARTSVGDKESKTPIMKAVECGHADVVEVLLSYQVDGEARDGAGDTSLHLAIKHLHIPIINALLKAGTNPNLKNMDGKTPLHYAVLKQDLKITDILLKNKADVNAIDSKQRTPLMYACQFGDENIVSLLLKKGASVVVKAVNGWSASDHALVKGHQTCVRLLDNQLRQHQDEDLLKDSTDSPSGMPFKVKRQNSKELGSGTQAIVGGSNAYRRASISRTHLPVPTQQTMYPTENNADDSDETVTFSSHCSQGKDAGSDSWADDTDISLGIEDKKGKGAMRVSLAKFIPKTSDNEDNEDGYAELNFKDGESTFGKRSISPTKKQEDIGNAALPRKGRVSFKEDNEISEVFTSFNNPDPPLISHPDPEPIYATVNKPKKLTLEQQRAFMDELGLSDNDDLTDGSAPICATGEQDNQTNDNNDEESSDWDTTPRSQFDQMSTIKLANNLQTKDLVFNRNDSAKQDDFQSSPKNSSTPGKAGDEDNENKGTSSIPSKFTNLRRESNAEENKCDKPQATETEESDWDSTVPSGQPTPRNEVTDYLDFVTPPAPTTNKDEYFQRTSSLRRMNLAASKIMALTDESPECIDMYIGQYKSAYEEVVNLGVVDDVAPDKMVKSQIMQELNKLLEANSAATQPGAQNKLLEAARTVTDRINQMIDVCSGEANVEDEIKATDSLEAQNKNVSPRLDRSAFTDDKETLDIAKHETAQNEDCLTPKDFQVPEQPKELANATSNGIVAKEDNGENIDTIILKSCQKLEESSQKLTSTPKPSSLTDFSSLKQKSGDLATFENGLLRDSSILVPTQKSFCQPGSEIFSEGLSGFNYLDSSDILKDDDLMSLTSTENEGSLTGVQYNKDTLMNFNLNDSASVAKIQEHLRESRQKLEKEKNQRTLLENQYRILQEENRKLHNKIEALIQEKTSLEETKISLEAKIRNLQYKLSEETDKSKEAEILLEQSKKQLEKIDQQCKKDFEMKQQTDHTLYQTEMELKRAKHSIQALEAENQELNTQFKSLIQGGIIKHQEQLQQLQQQLQSQQSDNKQTKEFTDEALQEEMNYLEKENQILKEQVSKLELQKNNANLSESREFLLKIEELQFEKRQAESALQECKHKHELEQHTLILEKRQLNDSVAKLQMERDKLQEDYIQAQVQYESAKQKTGSQKELQRNVEQSFQTKIQEMEGQNAIWKQELEKAQETNKELKKCQTSLKTKIAELQKELKEAESTLKYQMIQLEDAQHNKERFEQENNIQIYSLQEAKKSLEKNVHNLEIKKSGLEIELHHEKNKVDMLEKDLNSLQQNNIGNHGLLVQELQVDNAKLVAEVQHEKQKCNLLQQQLLEEQNARYTLDVDLKEATRQLEKQVLSNENNEHIEPILNQQTYTAPDLIEQKIQMEEDHEKLREAIEKQKRMENKFESELEKNRVLQKEMIYLKSSIKNKKEHWVAQLEREKKRMKIQIEKEKHKSKEAVERQKAIEVLLEDEVEKNHILQYEIVNTKSKIQKKMQWVDTKLSSSLPTKPVYIAEEKYQPTATLPSQLELDSYLRTELTKKLEEVNSYLEQQHQEYEVKMAEKENRLTAEKNKLQDEILQLRLNYETALSHKDQQAKEAVHFRDLYHHELFLKDMKGSLHSPSNHHMLYVPTSMATADPAFANNSAATAFKLWEKPGTTLPSPDFNGSFLHSTAAANFSSLNLGPKPQGVSGSSTTNTEYSEMFARWKNEMQRSIKRHLEAPPYDHPESIFIPTLNNTYPSTVRSPSNQPLTVANISSSLTKSKAELLSLLNRKYCL